MAGILHLAQEAIERHDLLSPQGLAKLALALTLLALVHQTVLVIYTLYFHPLSHVPGPPLWVAFPTTRVWYMTQGTSEFKVRELHERYGPVVRISPNGLSFTSPAAWGDIYGGHGQREMPKTYPPGLKTDTRKIISSSAADHARYRRAMLPAFSDRALLRQEPLIRVYVDLLMEKLAAAASAGEEATDMVRWYNLTTFDLIADLAYGKPLGGLAEGRSNVWLDSIAGMMRLMPILVMVGASPLLGRILQFVAGAGIRGSQRDHRARVSELANGRIHGAKERADRGDFMDFMMRSRGQPHEMTDDELVANADLIMVAGSETTATLLSGATYYMLKTPSALARATEEVRSAFASDDAITFNEVRSKLPYLMACLEEALRIFPPVPLNISRSVPPGPPVQIAGIMVPEKTSVGVHQLSAFTSETNFHKAREFHPERWLPEATADPASPFYGDRREVHKPFSFGPRDCIGRSLAQHEMQLIVAKLLWNFDLALDPSCDDWHNQKIFFLWSKPPLMVHIKSRFT